MVSPSGAEIPTSCNMAIQLTAFRQESGKFGASVKIAATLGLKGRGDATGKTARAKGSTN